jgi:ferrochelatase
VRVGVVLLNFGEPENPTLDNVTTFLELIFQANAPLEGSAIEPSQGIRSLEMAAARAPKLVKIYREIGGSPLNLQAREQAVALEEELQQRGREATCRVAFQFTPPFPAEVVRDTLNEGAERLVALPVYPLCGPSTTVAALATLEHGARAAGWRAGVLEIGGWHLHPDYLPFHTDHVSQSCGSWGVDLHEQSETLRELDHDLREISEARGLAFYRVPIPHVHPRFIDVLADLVEERIDERGVDATVRLRRCVCRPGGSARCTNGLRNEGTVTSRD